MVKSPGAPVLPVRDGSARFFFSRVRFARRVQSDFPVHEPGKLDDSPPCALSFGRAFSDVKRPRAVARARTSRDTRAHRRRPNERGFGAVVSRSHRSGGSRIRRYRASPTRVDGPPRRPKDHETPRFLGVPHSSMSRWLLHDLPDEDDGSGGHHEYQPTAEEVEEGCKRWLAQDPGRLAWDCPCEEAIRSGNQQVRVGLG